MRILIVTDSPQMVVLVNWINDLKKMGHEVKLATAHRKSGKLAISNYYKKSELYKFIAGVVNLGDIVTLKNEIKKYDPDFVWFHTINRSWSWASLLVPVKNHAQKLITLHDLNSIYHVKILEEMLDSNMKFLYFNLGLFKGTLHKLRSLIIRYFLSQVRVVSIGKSQTIILEANKILVTKRIQNYIMECQCSFADNFPKDNLILFAGRLPYKGLDLVIESVRNSSNWVLLIAGSNDLLDFTKSKLPINRYRYLGQLESEELYSYIHKVKFVAVLSQCYDNFPTIGLEALIHGSLPITTEITGISPFCKDISTKLVFRVNEIPNLDQLSFLFYSKDLEIQINNKLFTDKELFFDRLFSILLDCS